jgi:xanthine dehydrogenase large subunit
LISFRDDRVFIGNESVSFGELARKAYGARVHLSAAGFYKTPKIHWDRAAGKGHPFFYFAYGASCSEVAIDILTGEMNVRRVDILHDVGRSINPAVDIGQIEGGFVQGMGWLTTEELVYDEKGRLLTHAPSTYKIPVASDVPADFRVALFDGANRAETIYRSKAVGEPPLMLAISVFAAVADAIHSLNPGQPVALDSPATPEAILNAVGPVDAVAALAPHKLLSEA